MLDLDYWLKDNVLVSFFGIFIVAYVYYNMNLFGTKMFTGEYAKPLLLTVILLLSLLVLKTLMDSYCANHSKNSYRITQRNDWFSENNSSSSISDRGAIFLKTK